MPKERTLFDFFKKSPSTPSQVKEVSGKPKSSSTPGKSPSTSSQTVKEVSGKPKNNSTPGKSPSTSSQTVKEVSGKLKNNSTPCRSTSPKNLKKYTSDKTINSTPKRPREHTSVGNSKRTPKENVKRQADSDDDDDDILKTKTPVSSKKRRRIIVASDSEDEYKPTSEPSESEGDETEYPDNYADEKAPKKLVKGKISSTPLAHFKSGSGKKQNKSPASRKKGKEESEVQNGTEKKSEVQEEEFKEWQHIGLDWLKDECIKDKNSRPKSHPEYDPHTLFVPEVFKKNLTPAMRQWWELKSNYFDTVLFFKVGKFYELYHMDAVTGVNELDLNFMRGEFAHSGFPEIAYGRFSDRLVNKGYKVARVEQTETPQMMEERCKQKFRPTKFDKVVTREICQITTRGTKIFSTQDGEPMGASNNFLLAVTEKPCNNFDSLEYGVCFIDTSIAKFFLGQFTDDRHCSRLMTLAALFPPIEVLYEKSTVSKKTLQILSMNLSNVGKQALNSMTHFSDPTKVLKLLAESKYFLNDDGDIEWPEVIKKMLSEEDILNQTPLREYELAIKSLGAIIWYLKECRIEENLLTMKLFEHYIPVDDLKLKPEKNFSQQHMVLDGITLHNLEIAFNESSSEIEGTLLKTMNCCSTNFGKRLFRHWLCAPLCNPKSIYDRLNAIDDLTEIPDVVDTAIARLRRIPDLERLLSKIHAQGLSRSKDHPDSRAVFYEADIYNKKKIVDFLSTLTGFKESIEVVSLFQRHIQNFKSAVLKYNASTVENGGLFPDLREALSCFDEAFDHEQAKKEGHIIPSQGVDEQFDLACRELEDTQKELNMYLKEQQTLLNCKAAYVGSGRTRFQLEIPDKVKNLPDDYEFQGQRKGFKRYYTSKARALLTQFSAAENFRDSILKDITRRIFEKFDNNHKMWKTAVDCLSVIDVLISLYIYKRSSDVVMCRPEFVLPNESNEPFLEIIDGRHPTFLKVYTDGTFIPNSIYIGPKRENNEDINKGGMVILVTGPNMGGKSTLMRQSGTLVVMAHLGSYVPAESCRLTPVDRIFTRIGASDRITAGESTFYVEVSETACILNHATSDSLVLVDEFGRGTATHDGTALAYAVVDHLATKIKCRTLFSTHYHKIVEDFTPYPSVGLGHMSCLVEKDCDNPALENVTFLYKFIDGSCPKSYGFNVASMAGIPKEIINHGFMKAKNMETKARILKSLGNLLNRMTPDQLIKAINERIEKIKLDSE